MVAGFFLYLLPGLFFYCNQAGAQSVMIGSVADIDLRNRQLLGAYDSAVSFTVRPLTADKQQKAGWKRPVLTLLPVSLVQQFNTHHPYGWNDGAMIASHGYQVLVAAGAHISYGAFEVQLAPEWVFAANTPYASNTQYGSNAGGRYSRVFAGQSFIKASLGPVSAGLATQNLWWGPGTRSSLLMGNTAPGFLHGFLSSKRPLHTGIGDFEWQLIGGKLTADNSMPYENFNLKTPASPLNPDWRYLSAYVVSYHPKWVPGLFLGMTRALQRYKQDVKLSGSSFLNQYIPVLTKAVQKENAQGDDTMRTDQLASFYVRWVLAKAKAEFYAEWGYNDYNQNVRDYLLGPSHSAAYLVGFKKIVPLRSNRYLDLGFEMTQMSQSPDYLVREAGNWYVHGQILQGYTHHNQILGAGAGLGCNVQSLTGTWVNGATKFGVLFERVERDPQYHSVRWTDISIGFLPQWTFRGLTLSGTMQLINSANYAWDRDVNRLNVHARLSIQYPL